MLEGFTVERGEHKTNIQHTIVYIHLWGGLYKEASIS